MSVYVTTYPNLTLSIIFIMLSVRNNLKTVLTDFKNLLVNNIVIYMYYVTKGKPVLYN